jgi:hypothetical protein
MNIAKLFNNDPIKRLNKKYNLLLVAARDAQRSGDIKSYARLSAQAEAIGKQIDELRKNEK